MISEADTVIGEHYRVDYGTGPHDNYVVGKLKEKMCGRFYWEKPHYKKWKKYETLGDGSTVYSCRRISIASEEEIATLELLTSVERSTA